MSVGVAPAIGVSAPKPPKTLTRAGLAVKPLSTVSGHKSWTATLARSDKALLRRHDARPVNVMIKYDVHPPASYRGGAPGLAPTSPLVTHRSLTHNARAVATYMRYLNTAMSRTSRAVTSAVPQLKIRSTYATAFGGVEAQLPADKVGALLRVPGVVAVMKDAIQHPLDDATSFIGAATVWPSVGGQASAGSNSVVGVIDSGVWPESPFFVDNGLPAPPQPLSFYHCDFGDGSDTAHLGPTFTCNNKLIGAYNFTQTSMAISASTGQEFCNDTSGVCSARDATGHGTHVASVAVGDVVAHAVNYGVDRGPISGVAPGAHLIAFRVCLTNNCATSDAVQAVQQAIHDGVNVLNVSISGGADPTSDPLELALLDATNAGISVAAAAGNNGAGAGTVDHAGPWVTTVGAVSSDRVFASTLHLTADGGASLDLPGVTMTNGISSPTPVVLAATLPKAGGGNEDALCQSDLAAGAATGKVVVCDRGINAVADKGRRVLAGGAAGMILYNNSATVTSLSATNHYLPAIQVQFSGNAVANFVTGNTNVLATWAQGTPSPAQGDVMADFSSRGPRGDWIKPDIVAPGVQVIGGTTPQPDQTIADNGPSGNLFQAVSGTSAAAPHVAGAMALVRAAHPTWTPEEIKSALLTSAVSGVVKEDGVTPANAFDDGSGSLRVSRAVNPTVVLNETYANFAGALNNPLQRVDLNMPSIDATTMTGTLTTHRTFTNVSGHDVDLVPAVSAPAGVTITVGDGGPLSIAQDSSATFPITISAPKVADGPYQGLITLTPQQGGSNPVRLPVAFVRKQGVVTLSQTCSPTSFDVSTVTHCSASATNLATTTANVNLAVGGASLSYHNIGDPGAATPTGVGWGGTLTAAVPPQVSSVSPGVSPGGGYLPLSGFGVMPLTGVGDDSITNFNVPTFYYGAEPYSKIGLVSNGYLVIGGGDSSDLVFSPQHFPNAARPNNVVAPLWTDLNPPASTTGGIRIGTLTDNTNTWIVVDWQQIKNFGNATTHSFEVWLRVATGGAGTGPSSEDVSYAYGTGADAGNAAVGDPDSGVNWGAENRDGSSGANISSAPADGSQYQVHTLPPTAGGSKTIPYDISAPGAGSYDSVAELTSNLTPGTTQVDTPLTVTGKLAATMSFADGVLAQTYDGSPKPVTVTTDPADLSAVNITYDGSPTPPTEPGSYAVVATLDNTTYTAPELDGTLVVGTIPATLTIDPSTLTQPYDGTARPVTVTTSPPGLDGVSVSYDGSSTAPSAVGAYAVVVTLDNPHYTASEVDGTLTIGKGPATLTVDPASLDQVYDGSAKPVTVTTNPADLSGVSVTYDGSSTAPTDAGVYDVEVTLSNPSYAALDVSRSLAIDRAVAHVHLDSASLVQTYDRTPRIVTTTTTPASLDGVTVTYGGSATAPTVPGTYDVVATLDNANYTPAEAIGTLVVNKASSAISFTAPRTLLYGRSTTLHATMTTLGAPAVGQTVQLQAKPAGGSTWSNVTTAVTSLTGVASATVHPKRNTVYRWVFATSVTTLASTSPSHTIVVLPKLTIALTKSRVKHGTPVTIWGTVTPGAAKQKVSLQMLRSSRWVTLATAQLVRQKMPDGHRRLGYLFRLVRATKGKVQLRVRRAASSTLGSGISPVRTLTVT